MDRFKKIAKAILFPHPAVVVLLVIAGAAGLVWVFAGGNEDSWIAYLVYVLSFYALTVACTALIPWAVSLSKKLKELPKLSTDQQLKVKLYPGLTINLAYGIFQIITGLLYATTWMWTNGIYNIALAMIRFTVLMYERKLVHSKDEQQQLHLGWTCYRLCGFLLLILNLTLTGIVFQMIWQGEGSHYPELVLYAVAAFTFYRLTISIINVFKSRKNTSPILAATRNLDLMVALMSIFSLQTAMFSTFGGDFQYQLLMNSLTGGSVCLLVVLSALGMILHGNKIKKRISGGDPNG